MIHGPSLSICDLSLWLFYGYRFIYRYYSLYDDSFFSQFDSCLPIRQEESLLLYLEKSNNEKELANMRSSIFIFYDYLGDACEDTTQMMFFFSHSLFYL